MAENNGHKHNLSAHEHGHVKLAMAIEGNSVDVDLDGPSESFIGFEHRPVSKEDLMALSRAKDLWTKEMLTKLIIFPKNLNCRIEGSQFNQIFEAGVHSEIEATAKFICNGVLMKGTEIKIGLKAQYPKIKKLKLEIIDTDKTKSLDIKKAVETVRL